MAFPVAAGYTNLPNGAFTPVIYSKKAQIAFRKASVAQAITNTDYFGEIADAGDTVKIIKEPQLTVTPYKRGTTVATQDLTDDELTLVVDQANYFAFKVDDIEKKQAHLNWESLASNNAGYKLKDAFDVNVLTAMIAGANATKYVGTTAAPQAVGFDAGDMSPLAVMNRLSRYLDENNVPTEGRWFVAGPVFWELMQDENSKLIDRDFADGDILRNGQITRGLIRGFKCYTSNNLPVAGTGPGSTGLANYGYALAGHMSSTATAEQISKTESFRDPDSFADVVRGLHVFGRKVLRPEALLKCVYNMG